MNRRDLALFAAMLALTLLVAAAAPAFPQEPAAAPEAAPPAEGAGEAPTTPDSQTVERILREQEDLLRGQRFSYDPEGRRDPFMSLYDNIKNPRPGPRPPGVAGMLVSEIDLDGIIQDADGGDVAFFTGSDNKGYFLRVGDTVYDGTLIGIDAGRGAVTFRQQVDDPRMIKPFRDVVMKLVPHEESLQ